MGKIYPETCAALDALLGGAIKRGAILSEHINAVTADGRGRLAMDFHPADPGDDRPDFDEFVITYLRPHTEWDDGFQRYGIWHVLISRKRDPADNGKIISVEDGGVFDGVGNLLLPNVSAEGCRQLAALLTDARRVEMREAAQEAA